MQVEIKIQKKGVLKMIVNLENVGTVYIYIYTHTDILKA